ncbi:hypothetical protein [Argonema galeatum]|uniref:hypothetical protein n=1 Tax=Argonema galeatum TaxID=2942762 RepID=UPI0020133A5B|nr:hypothetical protein [Argonema galeatum]MCL1466369.1 hypothetical protein [Argonema galeatum A003/A1]
MMQNQDTHNQSNLATMTTIKEQLLAAIETATESILEETLEYLQTRKNASAIKPADLPIQDGEPILRGSKAKDLLKFAGTWQGDDFEKCLQLVYDTRSQAEF